MSWLRSLLWALRQPRRARRHRHLRAVNERLADDDRADDD